MEKSTYDLDKKPVVTEIILKGLKRTEEKVVIRELLFKEGEILTTKDLLASVQRIKNLRLFSYVRPLLKLGPKNSVSVILELSEKWSIIPFFSYAAGGGTQYLRAGIYDINWLGKYIETGAMYENWNKEHGAMLWFSNPRFMGKHTLTRIIVGNTLKPRYLYNRDGELQGTYDLKRKQFSFQYEREAVPKFRVGLLIEYFNDEIRNDKIEPDADPAYQGLLTQNLDTTTLLNTIIFQFDQVNYDIDIVSGKQSDLLISLSDSSLVSDTSFTKIKWHTQAYWQLPWRSYVAANFTVATTDSSILQQHYSVGGFEHIRGYQDGQFRDRSYWQANVEYRIPSYRSPWIILQHIFFFDLANTADRFRSLSLQKDTVTSAGTGIRLISPKVYSFNGRLDIALYTSGNSKTSISLGTQHFF